MKEFKICLSKLINGKLSRDARWMIILTVMTFILTATVNLIKSEKQVVVSIDGKTKIVKTYKSKVKDVLKASDINVSSKDKVYPQPSSHVYKGMTIKIKRAVPIKLSIGSKEYSVYTAEKTVRDMLNSEGVVLNKGDKVYPSVGHNIAQNMNVNVIRVVETTITKKESLAYNTVKKPDKNTPRGNVRLIRGGINGEKSVKYKIVYENGKIISQKKIGEEINRKPVDKVVAVGTISWFMPSRGSSAVMYTSCLNMKATSYTNCYKCTGKGPRDKGYGITATGTRTRRNSRGYSTVAVDPRVIPLGTKLYIEGYGFAIAEDTGSAVKGKIVDLYFDPGTREFRSWFTHHVDVYILK